jgi:hypothetical protein
VGGWLGLAGAVFPSEAVPLAVERLVRQHVTMSGIHNYAPRHLVEALDFLGRSPYPFGSLVAGWMPLERAGEAFERAGEAGVFRVGLRPGRERGDG